MLRTCKKRACCTGTCNHMHIFSGAWLFKFGAIHISMYVGCAQKNHCKIVDVQFLPQQAHATQNTLGLGAIGHGSDCRTCTSLWYVNSSGDMWSQLTSYVPVKSTGIANLILPDVVNVTTIVQCVTKYGGVMPCLWCLRLCDNHITLELHQTFLEYQRVSSTR